MIANTAMGKDVAKLCSGRSSPTQDYEYEMYKQIRRLCEVEGQISRVVIAATCCCIMEDLGGYNVKLKLDNEHKVSGPEVAHYQAQFSGHLNAEDEEQPRPTRACNSS